MFNKKVNDVLIRYVLAFILGLGNLFIFYLILTPITLYSSFYILDIFYTASLSGIDIIINNHIISLIAACIAGSAYYLLTVLNLLTPMKLEVRIKSFIFMFTSLFIINLIRIVILSVLFISSNPAFDFSHKILWYGTSSLFVIIIWFSSVKLFSIKSIPVYTDFVYLTKIIKKN